MDEHRRSLRHTVRGSAYFRAGHGAFQRGQLLDVSESGLGLVSDVPLTSLPEQVAFRLDGSGPLLFDVRAVWTAIHGDQHRVGLQLLPSTGASCDQKCLNRWLFANKPAKRRRRKAS